MRKAVFIFTLFILVIAGCQKYDGKESADTASINNCVTAAPQIEEKLDYIKEAHLPAQSCNPLNTPDVPPQAEVNKEEAEKLIITVGSPCDKSSKAVKQGDTVEFIKRNEGEYAEIPIIIDTTSQQGISMEPDSILIDCDAGWGIWEGIKPGGFVRSFHVQTNNTSNAKFTIKKILDNNNQNLLAEPLVFYVKIIDEPIHTKYIIDSVTEHPDFQYLPMPSSQLKLYGFSTECFTLYNWVITGYFTDNPKDGLIINYNLLKNDDPPYIHKIPNAGKITLTGINEDKTKLFFKTDSGKSGELDVTSKNGCYKIN